MAQYPEIDEAMAGDFISSTIFWENEHYARKSSSSEIETDVEEIDDCVQQAVRHKPEHVSNSIASATLVSSQRTQPREDSAGDQQQPIVKKLDRLINQLKVEKDEQTKLAKFVKLNIGLTLLWLLVVVITFIILIATKWQ